MLRFYGNLHTYSLNNAMLLMMQRPDGTVFASYNTWKRLGRQVNGGVRAAWVWCPIFAKHPEAAPGEERQVLVGFKPGPVHPAEDLVDIETNPLPALHRDLPDDHQDLFDLLAAHTEVEGVMVQLEALRPTMGGYAKAGHTVVINRSLDSRNRIAVLCHELAHIYLHQREKQQHEAVSARQAEAEAEAVAYVVMDQLGLSDVMNGDYLRHWQVSAQQLTESLERIHRGVKTLLRVLHLHPERERAELSAGQQT